MAIKIKAFLALEASLADRLAASCTKVTAKLFSDIERDLRAEDWDSATQRMGRLDLSAVFSANEPYILYVSRLALLFGASRVTASPGTSAVGLGFETGLVQQSVESMRQAIMLNLTQALIASGLQLIAKARNNQAVLAQKFNRHHEPAGSPKGGRFAPALAGITSMLIGGKSPSISKSRVSPLLLAMADGVGNPNIMDLSVEGTKLFGGEGLGIRRSQMPQIPTARRQDFFDSLGVQVTKMEIDPLTAKPVQSQISGKRAGIVYRKRLLEGVTEKSRLILSKDLYVIDGHHNWAATVALHLDDPKVKLPVYLVQMDHGRLLKKAHEYGVKHGFSAQGMDAAYVAKLEGSYLGSVLKAAKPYVAPVLPFASFMNTQGQALFNIASSLHTSRLSAFGYTAEASYLGITEYRINEQLDGRTCDVCRLMHGKVFKVQEARNLLDLVIRTQDPDELKSLQPWPDQSSSALEAMAQMTDAELVSRGWHVPPFHPRCRGLLDKAGKTQRLQPRGAPLGPSEDYKATKDDFEQLGINLPPAKVELWNALMKTPPAEVVAQLTGKTLDQVLNTALLSDTPQKALGIERMAVTSTGVNVELLSLAHGSKNVVKQDYYFRKDLSLYVGLVEVAEGDEGVVRKLLKALVGTASNSAMKRLTVVAGSELGGYAWAKYGAMPTQVQWLRVKAQIAKQATETLISTAFAAEVKAFELIMASDDPKSIFALSDLPTLGRPLLSQTQWAGVLPFEDVEAMTRFIAAMGGKL